MDVERRIVQKLQYQERLVPESLMKKELPILKTNPIDIYKPKVLEVFNVEIKAVVDLTVKKNGKVADVEIVEFPYDKYDQSLLESLQNLEFIPAKVNSKPISVRYRMPIIFKG